MLGCVKEIHSPSQDLVNEFQNRDRTDLAHDFGVPVENGSFLKKAIRLGENNWATQDVAMGWVIQPRWGW
jgi:hypothetical protein